MTVQNICPSCFKPHSFFHRAICLRCHERYLTAKRLDELESGLKPANEYNSILFNLYLSYIRKMKLRASHGHQAAKLKGILESEKIPVITCWAEIDRLSSKYQLWDLPENKTGCAFKKIGKMLNGLGILDVSWKEGKESRRQDKVLAQISPKVAVAARDFIKVLIRQNRSQRTATIYLEHICKLELWLRSVSSDYGAMLLSVSDFESYLDYLREKKYSKNQIYSHYCSLNKFYRWCVFEKIILNNPAEQVSVSKPYRSLEICSEADLKTLRAYVKNTETDPSDAFLISLVLYFGFTIEQLCLAQLAPRNGEVLKIILATRQQTYSRRYKRRQDHLDLPSTPAWFLKIQQRYDRYWCERYKEIQHISLRRPLFLQHKKCSNTPIEPSVLEGRLRRATKRALDGRSISWRILHSSCGVLYTRYQDASILTRLGWSPPQASHYVYITKKIHTPTTDK